MVQSKDWEAPELTDSIEEMSLDRGTIGLHTPFGCPCEWKEYKALNVHEKVKIAYFKDNKGGHLNECKNISLGWQNSRLALPV